MANFGASKPWIAKWDEEMKKYKDAFKCGELVNTSINPQYNTASLHGDNRKVEEIRLFKTADITLGVTRIPVKAATIMFGHNLLEDGSEVQNIGDDGNYVGYAFITQEMESGARKYRACIICKAKFNEGQVDYETQGENVTFKTPTISGSALSLDNGDWCIKSPYFDTEDATENWIKKKLDVEEGSTEEPSTDNSVCTGQDENPDQQSDDQTEDETY